MSSRVVSYRLEDETEVSFEYEPIEGYSEAGAGDVSGALKAAIGPAVEAAQEVLGRLKELRPDSVEVKFGIKIAGEVNWVIAKAASEANFEVTLGWRREFAASDG